MTGEVSPQSYRGGLSRDKNDMGHMDPGILKQRRKVQTRKARMCRVGVQRHSVQRTLWHSSNELPNQPNTQDRRRDWLFCAPVEVSSWLVIFERRPLRNTRTGWQFQQLHLLRSRPIYTYGDIKRLTEPKRPRAWAAFGVVPSARSLARIRRSVAKMQEQGPGRGAGRR